ncbi:hypothetical protein BO82DRAFT_115978 [Aspergillus uvarum CBS 121591]|uniref:Uncharacterized protein n=1 Tax=Aspergillus uvarum CBS 121591 TaxID=1448315 RepID=A0A319CLQ2_9EURO|nr:hypothetical protein BO82DRAFT_115978 [Aspergillus uvarum CBS 121591]PYH86114.1 hypothetical protein BO82DRAFT_115978 [Aspergillus uvarum CBS 121591]
MTLVSRTTLIPWLKTAKGNENLWKGQKARNRKRSRALGKGSREQGKWKKNAKVNAKVNAKGKREVNAKGKRKVEKEEITTETVNEEEEEGRYRRADSQESVVHDDTFCGYSENSADPFRYEPGVWNGLFKG